MKTSDFAIDLHTGTSFQEVCKTFTPSHMFGEVSEKALEMAKTFGIRLIYEGMYDEKAWFENILASIGIPALGVELGKGSSFQAKYVEKGVNGILNVLRYLGMLKGTFTSTEDHVLIHTEVDVRAKSGGLIKMKKMVWDEVSKGDVIASIYSPVGQHVQDVEAPINGYVNNIISISTVSVGERIATIGSK
jgi:predicted deacylase